MLFALSCALLTFKGLKDIYRIFIGIYRIFIGIYRISIGYLSDIYRVFIGIYRIFRPDIPSADMRL